MFGSLIKYSNKSYFKEHATFDVYIGETGYRYYVFATYETDEIGDTYSYNFETDEEFENYIKISIAKREYDTGIDNLTKDDKIITLSTCTRGNDTKRYIVQMVRREKLS
jgi:sortase B